MGIIIKKFTILCVAFLISLIFSTTTGQAAIESHYVGFNDQLLDFSHVQVIGEDSKVPLEEIAAYLDIPYETEKGITFIRKNDFEISYNESSNITTKNGTPLSWVPIVQLDGKLFISVKFIATEIGYKIENFPKQKTQRIYRDDWIHMSHADYENYLNQQLKTKQTQAKPTKATIYLTFDDGPNKFTTLNNSTLKKYNVPGTFFFLGNHMKKNSSIVKSVLKDGHYIGTHSMTHDKTKVYQSANTFIKEMNEGTKLIKEMTGLDSKLVRTPYGSKPHITAAMKDELIKNNYKLWDWDVDSQDWKYTDKQADQIVKNVKVGVEKAYKSGDRDIIILLHDRSQTTKALPQIIEWLQKEGYTLKTYEPKQHIVQNFLHDKSL
ncbi:polysaccharide deacetylase family protein [Psychrobacillus sp. FJAT-51614]|uniref:Polysaccharide deacetylase family protein n=1 Tax=Psychrobacillus mangrovi TaxID=3117745 RepID=A0ABU8F5E1_9BACI